MLIDMIAQNSSKLIAYVITATLRCRGSMSRLQRVSIDISDDARVILHLGRSKRLTDKQAALQRYRDNLTTVECVLEDPPSG
jgi:hypothetical protein